MIEAESELKIWGNSFGIIVPKEIVKEEKLNEGDKIFLLITKKTDALRKTFGTAKFKRSTAEILREGDKESWDE